MGLTKSFEIPRINLGFDYNNFDATEIIYDPSRFREVFFIFLDLIAIIGKQKMTII